MLVLCQLEFGIGTLFIYAFLSIMPKSDPRLFENYDAIRHYLNIFGFINFGIFFAVLILFYKFKALEARYLKSLVNQSSVNMK